ncbi:hypothetical protein CEP52_017192 [Fusarium oligoseptatum]|uniref:Uncharacterized protein n=1 Tax=Fusarium oligoseptatum TaxID=2604345 RepID=A0A428RV57_9HYPO|nr:hypothetical protein CEP52_017192 [Fusarium oligoseptatum]
MLREREIKKPIMRINDEKNELTIQGVFFDTLIDIGTLFTNPDLSNENPTTENQTLLEAVAFVSQLKQTGSEYNVFTAFWKSLVAGKNGDGKLRSPESFAEVFSFLLDQTTGKSPSVPGQTYSIRQKRPRGKGGLELSSLETRADAIMMTSVVLINQVRGSVSIQSCDINERRQDINLLVSDKTVLGREFVAQEKAENPLTPDSSDEEIDARIRQAAR